MRSNEPIPKQRGGGEKGRGFLRIQRDRPRRLPELPSPHGHPFVGSPDEIATEFANHSRAGFRGLAVSFVNYLKDVPYFCDEVLPRLARMGLRAKN